MNYDRLSSHLINFVAEKGWTRLKGPIRSASEYVDFAAVELEGGKRTCPAVIGLAILAGTEDGRGCKSNLDTFGNNKRLVDDSLRSVLDSRGLHDVAEEEQHHGFD